MEFNDVFQRACLIQLSSSIWQGTRMLEQGIMEKLGKNSEWLRGKKFLINPEYLGPIRTTIHQARNSVLKYALPFPITAIYLVPKEVLTSIDRILTHYKEEFWSKVQEFEYQYELAKEEARDILKELFNETDYPGNISSKFNFEWRFLTLDVPGKSAILPPEVYEREKAKFVTMMEESRELAISALRAEFGEIIKHLVERLNSNNGKPAVLKSSMFNKLTDFFNSFGSRNIFNDDSLLELVEQAKEVISGVSPYGLKYNDGLRQQIASEMSNLKTAINEAIEDLPRRKIRLAA
jgi:hypothetical protein